MKVTTTTVYEGPNIHAPVPVIHWRIELEGLEEWPTGRLGAAFVDALGRTPDEIGEGLGTYEPARQAASVEMRTDARG